MAVVRRVWKTRGNRVPRKNSRSLPFRRHAFKRYRLTPVGTRRTLNVFRGQVAVAFCLPVERDPHERLPLPDFPEAS